MRERVNDPTVISDDTTVRQSLNIYLYIYTHSLLYTVMGDDTTVRQSLAIIFIYIYIPIK